MKANRRTGIFKLLLVSSFFIGLLMFAISQFQPPRTKTANPELNERVTPFINISEIALKSPADVERVLGTASSTEKVKPNGTPCKSNPCNKMYYQGGKYEIVYINGKADWITINEVSNYPFSSKSIELLGLPPTKPFTYNPPFSAVWRNVSEIKEFNFFGTNSGVLDYIYIKAVTN